MTTAPPREPLDVDPPPPSGARWMPSPAALRVVAALAAPLIAASVLYKVAKVVQAGAPVDPATLAPLLSSDLLFGCAWAVFWAGALGVLAGRPRAVALWLLHLTTASLLLYAVVEHGFHVKTGTLLDWDLLAYSLTQAAQVRRILASETDPLAFATLALAVGLALWPLAVPRWRRAVLQRGGARWSDPTARAFAGLAGGLLLAALVARGGAVPEGLERLRGNPAASLMEGAWAELSGDWRLSLAPVEIKPREPLVIARTARTRRHNVVIIALESERAISMTPYNPGLDTTPFLDRFAREGAVVDNAYTIIPQTTKALVPIHCGIYPKISPEIIEPSPNALPSECLASLLRRQGYSTGYVQAAESIFERGAELVKAFGFETLKDRDNMPHEGFDDSSYFGYEDDVMLQPTFDWIDAQKGPFFLGMLTLVSHHFYKVPKGFAKKHYTDDVKLDNYLNTIRYEDRFLQKLVAGFEARGLLDKTLFVIVADHGQAFGEHGLYQHGSTYHEEGIKVPMILVGPGIEALPRRVGGLRQQIDIVPTVLEALGFEIIAGSLPGISLFDPTGHGRLFHACWRKRDCLAMREGRFKTVYRYDKGPPEVFDLVADPGEKRDLVAAGEVDPAELERRISRMKAWRDEVNARYEAQGRRRTRSYVSTRRPEPQHRADVLIGDFARLIGYDLQHTRTVSGEPNWLTFYFEVLREPRPGWELFVHVNGPNTKMINVDHVPVEGSYPISDWKAGEFIADRTWLRVKPQKPSGPYEVFIGVYAPERGDARASIRPGGEDIGEVAIASLDRIHVTTIDIENPAAPYHPPPAHGRARLPPDKRHLVQLHAPPLQGRVLDVVFGDAVRLRGVHFSATSVQLGEPVTLTWQIEVLRDGRRWDDVFVHLIGPGGAYHNAVHTPVLGAYPVGRWAKGEFIRDPQTITLPPTLPPGPYAVWMGYWNPGARTPRRRLLPKAPPGLEVSEGRLRVGTLQVRGP